MECLGNFDGIVLSLACILAKQHTVHGGKYFLKTPGNAISKTLNFKMSQDASALKNLCLWWKFQCCLLFIISLILKIFLTALYYKSVRSRWLGAEQVYFYLFFFITTTNFIENWKIPNYITFPPANSL